MKLEVVMWPINPVCTEASGRLAGPSEWFSGTQGAAEESHPLPVLTTQVPSGNALIKCGTLNAFVLVAFLTKRLTLTNRCFFWGAAGAGGVSGRLLSARV